MPKIKGPIKLKGFKASDFLKEQGLGVVLPFEAKGWKSSKMPEGVNLDGKKPKPEPKPESKEELKEEPKEEEKEELKKEESPKEEE